MKKVKFPVAHLHCMLTERKKERLGGGGDLLCWCFKPSQITSGLGGMEGGMERGKKGETAVERKR